MSPEFQIAFTLMSVGMLTVFIILLLVVYVGKTIIWFTNKLDVQTKDKAIVGTRKGFAPAKVAAISAAVTMVTSGRGQITHIEKI